MGRSSGPESRRDMIACRRTCIPGAFQLMSGSHPARAAPPEERVRAMFDGLVPRYDLVNDILSLGLDRWWRRSVARAIADAVGPRTMILDLGCGTGRLGLLLADRARVVGLDVSPAMLEAARSRSAGRLRLVQGSAFRLPF